MQSRVMQIHTDQRYANACIDRQVGQPIVTLGPRNLIGRTVCSHTPSTDDIKTYKYIQTLKLVIAIGM